MKKAFIATIALAAGLSFAGNTSQASAATWHKGTPKAIRGYYKHNNYTKWGNYPDFIIVKKNQLTAGAQISDPYTINNVHYKKIGKYTYWFKGKEFYSKKWQNVRVVATKHKIKYRVLSPNSMRMAKYSEIAYR